MKGSKMKVMKRKVAALALGTVLIGSSVAEAGNREAVFGAMAAIIATAAIANAGKHRSSKKHYRKSSRKKSYRRSSRSRKTVVVMSDEKRIQKTLQSLGFYNGSIDGALNSYETRSAIRKMNEAYGISQTSYLKPEIKEQLIYLANLYDLDRKLHTIGNTKSRKGTRLQAALKVHGVYTGKIDGVVGKGTRRAISEYQNTKGMASNGRLTPDEVYDLVSSAVVMNDRNIHKAIEVMKVDKAPVGTRVASQSEPAAAPQVKKASSEKIQSDEGHVAKVNGIMQGKQVEDEEEDFILPDA